MASKISCIWGTVGTDWTDKVGGGRKGGGNGSRWRTCLTNEELVFFSLGTRRNNKNEGTRNAIYNTKEKSTGRREVGGGNFFFSSYCQKNNRFISGFCALPDCGAFFVTDFELAGGAVNESPKIFLSCSATYGRYRTFSFSTWGTLNERMTFASVTFQP